MANSVDPDQTAPGAVCSGSTLSASILNSLVMLGNYLQQTNSAGDIFRCLFSWRLRANLWFHKEDDYHRVVRILWKIIDSFVCHVDIQ